MSKINENRLAEKVASAEGLKQSLSIAQIKEVVKLTLNALGREWAAGNAAGVVELVEKHIDQEI